MLDDPPYGMTTGECSEPFVALDHPQNGPIPWSDRDPRPVLEFALAGWPPGKLWDVEPSSFTPNFVRVTLRRVPIFAERCLIGWAYAKEDRDAIPTIRAAFPEFGEFERDLQYECAMEFERHAYLLRALHLRRN